MEIIAGVIAGCFIPLLYLLMQIENHLEDQNKLVEMILLHLQKDTRPKITERA